MAAARVSLIAIPGIPLIRPGDDLAALLIAGIEATGHTPRDRDVLVVAQKVVSKAEGRYRRLDEVIPSPRARDIAQQSHKDPRLIEAMGFYHPVPTQISGGELDETDDTRDAPPQFRGGVK